MKIGPPALSQKFATVARFPDASHHPAAMLPITNASPDVGKVLALQKE